MTAEEVRHQEGTVAGDIASGQGAQRTAGAQLTPMHSGAPAVELFVFLMGLFYFN